MRLLSALFGRWTSRVKPRGSVRSGEDALDLDRLLEEPERRDALRRAKGLLADLSPESAQALVSDVVRAFFSYVVDLPASERHHHAQPFGLLEHSLHVAELALRDAQSEFFVADTRAYPEEQEHRLPRLRYATWFLGLLHDAGKVAQVVVEAPGAHVWNPYVETLEDFYRRQGRANCRWTWRLGRGFDAHTWHTAYLMGKLLAPPVGAYLGAKLTNELIEQKTPAAKEVHRLIWEADRRSAQAGVARKTEARPTATTAQGEERLLVGGGEGEYLDRIPGAFRQALESGALRMDADALLGEKYVLLRYPVAVLKLALAVRSAAGREFAAARALHATEEGARELAHYLHRHRKLFYDGATDQWKLKAKIAIDGSFEDAYAILIERAFLEPAFAGRADLRPFEGGVEVFRADGGKSLAVDGFSRRPAPPVAPPVAPPPPPSLTPVAVPAVVALRKFISPEVLLDDIRNAVLDGTIPTNQWNKQCYVLPEVTYLASPKGFQCLVDRGLYNRDPKREVNVYLDALAKMPCVRKQPGGRVLRRIAVRPGARPLWVVAFDTQGFFRSAEELARAGFWTESPIRELSDGEAEAAARAAAPAAEVAHAA